MKIIAWNCCQKFETKKEHVIKLKPDILVVPECRKISENNSKYIWVGENLTKGLGVLAYSDYTLELHESYNPRFKYILPIKVKGPNDFILFAVWTHPVERGKDDLANDYVGQLRLALEYYENLLSESTIIIGDFNMDKNIEIKYGYKDPARITTLKKFLNEKGIESTYHVFFKEELGCETKPTLYQWRKKEKPYHIDYCFASKNFIEKLEKVIVGEYEDWIKLSDHMPIIIIFRD